MIDLFSRMHQLCRLVISTRKALHQNSRFSFAPEGYLSYTSCSFVFDGLFESSNSYSAKGWYEKCIKRGLKDIYLVIGDDGDDRMVCLWKNGKTTSFVPVREYNPHTLHYVYQEYKWNEKIPKVENPSRYVPELKKAFRDILDYASERNCVLEPEFLKKYCDYFEQDNITSTDSPEHIVDFLRDVYDHCALECAGSGETRIEKIRLNLKDNLDKEISSVVNSVQ